MWMPDPWDWRGWKGPEDDKPLSRNEEHLIRWGLTVAFCLFVASLYPAELMPMLGVLLLMGAIAAATAAELREEPVFAAHFTLWDEAAASAALGLLALLAPSLRPGLVVARLLAGGAVS
ncbi:hypothetical protein [Azospirillum rugosum]|uniref:SPW repeat-containing protein n=1 Tax=Azospirillum rugosum TaxID=416170 RepID=A0ABS4SP68_9PROT|nr:hypothetical protein [Azospirillum rugosum]MBP2294350.1 hypothetical protein [Azospirillum rugosum]MDQ0527685.1 hypothetical protein [Azospirillum rugosum]